MEARITKLFIKRTSVINQLMEQYAWLPNLPIKNEWKVLCDNIAMYRAGWSEHKKRDTKALSLVSQALLSIYYTSQGRYKNNRGNISTMVLG